MSGMRCIDSRFRSRGEKLRPLPSTWRESFAGAPGGSYFVTAMIEVNPISQEMLERIRRWVSRPPGSSNATPGDSLFGSFVGLFVARIGQAERTLAFRTQSVVVPQ